MQVSSRNIKSLPEGRHRLENGVYLVKTKSCAYWIFRYMMNGRRRDVGMGGIDQPITAVRAKASKFRAFIADGIDPLTVCLETPKEKPKPTLAEIVPDAIKHLKFLRQWTSKNIECEYFRLINRIFIPDLGNKRVDLITTQDVVSALRPFWVSESSAIRSLAAIRGVLSFALSEGFVERNVAEWRGNLDGFLPRTSSLSKGRTQAHHSAVSHDDLKKVAAKLAHRRSITARCVLFGILTVLRCSEYRCARWDEINFDEGTLTIPPERRKDKKTDPFVVPLPAQALRLLSAVPCCGDFIFTADITPTKEPVRASTLWHSIKRASINPITLHGTRSTFSDWCARTDKNLLISEKCLMHSVGNKVFRAYQRDDFLEKRRDLLQAWADEILPMETLEVELSRRR